MKIPLRIGLLSYRVSTKTLRPRPYLAELMIKESALKRGHILKIYSAERFLFSFDKNKLGLYYRNKKFTPPDVMIIRPGFVADSDAHLTIVKQLRLMGVPVVNNSLPIMRSKNKIRTLQLLGHAGIPIPKTVVINSIRYLDDALKQVGKFPVIIKLTLGTFGNGVSIIESRRSLRSMVDLIVASNTPRNSKILIQEYVKEAKGKDIRVFVIDGKIVASMERSAARGEFRSNFHQGGKVSSVELTDEERSIALKATELIGLDIAGVDVIRTSTGPKILEINANPGLVGITEATGIDVGGKIVEYAEKVAKKRKVRNDSALSG